jgi:hypothetical protein
MVDVVLWKIVANQQAGRAKDGLDITATPIRGVQAGVREGSWISLKDESMHARG